MQTARLISEIRTLGRWTEGKIDDVRDAQGITRHEISNLMLRLSILEAPKVELDEPLPEPVRRHFNWWQRFWQRFFLGFEVE